MRKYLVVNVTNPHGGKRPSGLVFDQTLKDAKTILGMMLDCALNEMNISGSLDDGSGVQVEIETR